MGQVVIFGETSDGPWIIDVYAELTDFNTTEAWLNAQEKGSTTSVGYKFIRWIGDKTNQKALVEQYIGPGESGEYGKRLQMIVVKNKSLYTVYLDTWHKANEEIMLEEDIERALESFQATGLITTDESGSYKTIDSWYCDAIFNIPLDWNDRGYLNGSKIVSPEDERKNKEWDLAHPELVTQGGGSYIGLDSYTFAINCPSDIKTDELESGALKTMDINGVNAYEIAEHGKYYDGTPLTNYSLFLTGKKTMKIFLGQTEYNDLSKEAKQVIQSIKFE